MHELVTYTNFLLHIVEVIIVVILLVHLWARERLIREFSELLNELSTQVDHLRSRNEEWLLDR